MISSNRGYLFLFSSYTLIRMLPEVSGTDFNFSLIRMDLWAAFTRTSLYDLKVPFPHSNSGKRTLAYSATKLFNDLSSDLKEFSISSSLISKFLPVSLKSKLRSLFLSHLSSAEHLEELLCSTCRYFINCHCFS